MCMNWYAADIDYTEVTTDVTFPPMSQLPRCVDIPIIDDVILEENEVFLVQLSSSAATIAVDTATVTIIDNDGKRNYNNWHSAISS